MSNQANSPVRVRFAPSPTGYLHIGGARTALFNYLFARKHQGVFVLRIEDTDRGRSTPEAVKAILDGLRFLGLDWDEGPEKGGEYGPYFQSERIASYNRYIDQLLARGRAYRCFCSKERVDRLREEQKARKERMHYDRKCRGLEAGEADRRAGAGEPHVVRFAVPEGRTVVHDHIRGDVVFEHQEIDDFIIQRADRTCIYNFAVVGDDTEMKITHVIRGEDHLSNTPKQILLFRALDLTVPEYAHIPLILGPGREKLSKRHGAVSVTEYQEKGYLPEAMVNFLARLGWSYDDKQEIFSMEELIEKFSLEGISKSGAMYDLKKLNHLGAHYIRKRGLEEIVELAIPHLVRGGLLHEGEALSGRPRLVRMVALEKDRIEHLSQLADKLCFYFQELKGLEAPAVKQLQSRPDMLEKLGRYAEALAARFDERDPKVMEAATRQFAEAQKMELKDIAQAARAALTGRTVTPPLFDVMAVLGKEACLRRLKEVRKLLG
ncbi:MAG: glutamate--tRNA ligase [Planctomycetes bacterium]|nr:glutamate--tRNA ligase [Planctomycetota bacterium]